MLGLTAQTQIFIRSGVTDGRLGFEGLKGIVVKVIREDPLAGGQLFVFANRARTRVKFLWADGTGGLYLATKRMRTGGFDFPKNEGKVQRITPQQLEILLRGVNFVRRPPPR
jgi:transposase